MWEGLSRFRAFQGKAFRDQRTADGSVPYWERRAAEHVSWIRKRVVNPSALVRCANRNVSCDIATVIEDERRRFRYLGVLHLWLTGVFTCALARRQGSSFLRSECFRFG